MNGNSSDRQLPQHVAENVEKLVELQRRSEDRVEHDQRLIERTTRAIGRPRSAYIAIAFVMLWTVTNAVLGAFGRAFDPPPFYWLQGAVSLSALLMTIFILTTQRRQGNLAERRSQLNLQLTMLSEQKIAKMIDLMEQLRHDMPQVADRVDADALIMTQPADPHAVVEALETHDPHEP